MRYLALLRGINVGGHSLIKMYDLTAALTSAGFIDVTTYIQSGNVFVTTPDVTADAVATRISTVIKHQFGLDIAVVAFDKTSWQTIVTDAPDWWGHDSEWKHNLLVMLPPAPPQEVLAGIGPLKAGIESLQAGAGVVYQSIAWSSFGRSAGGKLAGKPIYKQLTVRNFNTATKLAALFDK